jgi:hypothetical protein
VAGVRSESSPKLERYCSLKIAAAASERNHLQSARPVRGTYVLRSAEVMLCVLVPAGAGPAATATWSPGVLIAAGGKDLSCNSQHDSVTGSATVTHRSGSAHWPSPFGWSTELVATEPTTWSTWSTAVTASLSPGPGHCRLIPCDPPLRGFAHSCLIRTWISGRSSRHSCQRKRARGNTF